jgi:hypothetical protein
LDTTTVIGDLQAFGSRRVPFSCDAGKLFWADAWLLAADVLGSPDRDRRIRGALAAHAFGFADLAALLIAGV